MADEISPDDSTNSPQTGGSWPLPPWAVQMPPAQPGWTPQTAANFGAYPSGSHAHHMSDHEKKRHRRTRFVMAGVVVVAMGIGVGIGALVAKKPTTAEAQNRLTHILAKSNAAAWFHYSEYSTTGGAKDTIIGTAGPTSGSQLITQSGQSGTDVFILRLVEGTVYFKGNEPAVADQLGITTNPSAYAGMWIAVQKGDVPYHSFEVGITNHSNLSQIQATFTPISVGVDSHGIGELVGGVAGPKNKYFGTALLRYSRASTRVISLTAHATIAGTSTTLNWEFLHWNKAATISKPPTATPYATLASSGGSSTG